MLASPFDKESLWGICILRKNCQWIRDTMTLKRLTYQNLQSIHTGYIGSLGYPLLLESQNSFLLSFTTEWFKAHRKFRNARRQDTVPNRKEIKVKVQVPNKLSLRIIHLSWFFMALILWLSMSEWYVPVLDHVLQQKEKDLSLTKVGECKIKYCLEWGAITLQWCKNT